jgi:hypothetical protein
MARYKINTGETRSDTIALAAGDSLFIDVNGVALQAASSPAVTLSGTGALVRNNGLVQTEGAGFAITGALEGVIDTTIRNEAGATISGGAGGVRLTSAAGTTGELYLYNAGTIEGGSTRAVELNNLRATTIKITNAAGATISNAGSADVVRPGNDGAASISIDNAGTILARVIAGASASGDAIDLQPVDGGLAATILNRGTGVIEGGKHGITGANDATITNLLGGQIIGRNGSGINFDTETADGDTAVTVINNGLISGRYDGYGDGDGDGVDVDYVVVISNRGTIEGVSADNIDDFADGIAAGGGTIRNFAGGFIYGETNGILIDDGDRNGAYAETRLNNAGEITGLLNAGVQLIGDFDDSITNSGTITGLNFSIDTGAGNDKVVNSGTLDGVVLLRDGDDVYRSVAGGTEDIVDGGTGDDRIFAGSASQTIVGGAGRDVMSGGGGDDTFLYQSYDDSNIVTGIDRITDFDAGDTLDFNRVDADSVAAGDQNFTLIGTAAFSGIAGELRISDNGINTSLIGDTNGDGLGDFVVKLEGLFDPAVLATQIIL